MKKRTIFLIISLFICAGSMALIILEGNPRDKVDLNSIAEVGESVAHNIGKVGKMLTEISKEKEIKIGDGIHNKLLNSHIAKNIKGTPVDIYVNEVGKRVAENVNRKNIPYNFHIVDSPMPNASALPGGHVYITLGLLEKIESEAELASILGHEIIHIDAKHAIGAIQYKVKMDDIIGEDIGTYVNFGYNLLFRPVYSEVQEEEADLAGVYLAYQAGYHPMAVVNIFKTVNKAESQGQNKSITPIDDTLTVAGGLIERYFSTHPMSVDRIDKIKKYIIEKGLLDKGTRLYIGQKNYIDKQSYTRRKYKEEFKKEYILIEVERESADAERQETLLGEVYSVYGKIYKGMDIEILKQMLPKKNMAFVRETRMGYKNIPIYLSSTKNLKNSVSLWIELQGDKVKGVKLLR